MVLQILNCASMSPWYPRWHLGTTCLLVETNQGLTLVDTGLGLHDYENPSPMVRFFHADFGIQHDPELTAVRQIVRLGYCPEDVSDIILTHLHFDHAGGLPDFPHARVHVHKREYEALLHPRRWIELAYDRNDFRHCPDWILYEKATENWLGWDAIRLPFTQEIYLIPLFGHTRGHCGVAMKDGDGWIFQCADALTTNAEFDILPFWLSRIIIGPHLPRLRTWSDVHPEVRLLAGHMWQTYFDGEKG